MVFYCFSASLLIPFYSRQAENLITGQKHLWGRYAMRLKQFGQVAFGGDLAFLFGGRGLR